MNVDVLELTNFRNYHKLKIKFSPFVNIIHGKNGSGKTNIVEAIYVLGLTKSFRNINEKHLILKDKDISKVKGTLVLKSKNKYEVDITKEGKKVLINNNKVNLLSDYISNIPIIVFSPDDLKLLKETPIVRRKFLNIELSFYKKEYLKNIACYNKLLKQRNSYLKQSFINSNKSSEYLDILTEKLFDYGLKIFNDRKEFIEKINQKINEYYSKISKSGAVNIKYVSNFEDNKENMLKKYKKYYQKELNFGKTLLGIHLDDIDFYLDQNKVKEWASEGQLKNIIVAMKLVEVNLIHEERGYYPILILDDLFSEIDKEKINNILKLLPEKCQIFITTTELSKVKKSIKENSKIIKVNNGIVEE
jgi:DNA replication and repair protein RecF